MPPTLEPCHLNIFFLHNDVFLDINKKESHEAGGLKRNKRLAKETIDQKPVYCICREEERPGMIGCDYCDEWYHTQCLSLTKDEAKRLSNENWSCVKCELKK